MEIQYLAGLVFLAVAGFIWQDVNAIACLSTKVLGSDKDVSSLESIGQIEECRPTEVCFVEKFIYEESPTNTRYRAGCRDVSECKLIGCSNNVTEPIPTHRTKRSDEITLCTECCYSDTCNIKGCNASAIDESQIFKKCFVCTGIHPNDTRTCNEMDYCGAAEVCAIEADITKRVYNLKCADTKACKAALIAANVSGSLALKCFEGHLKNFNPESNHTDKTIDDILPCPTGLVPTTPTTTTKTQLKTLTPISSPTTTSTSTTRLTIFTTQRKTTTKITTIPPSIPTSTLQTPKLPPMSTTTLPTPKPSPLITSTLLTPKLPPLITTTQPTTLLIIAPTLPSIPKTPAPSSPVSTLIPSSPVTATPKPPTIPVSFVNVTINQQPTTKVVITTTTSTPAPTTTMPATTTTKPLTTTTKPSSIRTMPTTTNTTPATTTTAPTTTPTTPTTTTTKPTTTPTTPTTTTTKPTTTPATPTTTTITTTAASTTPTTTTRRRTTHLTTTIRTTTPAPAPVGHTIPPNPTTCFVCLEDVPDMCDDLYVETDCQPPNNYCINEIKNHADGSKTVNRTCGNFDRCYKDWYHGSSDKDVCQNFDENQYITLDFECVYCCVQDLCNDPMKPSPDTLYEDK